MAKDRQPNKEQKRLKNIAKAIGKVKRNRKDVKEKECNLKKLQQRHDYHEDLFNKGRIIEEIRDELLEKLEEDEKREEERLVFYLSEKSQYQTLLYQLTGDIL